MVRFMGEIKSLNQHTENISKLVTEFGEDKEREIRYEYENLLESISKRAKILDYIPILVYKSVKELIKEKYSMDQNNYNLV